MSKTTSPKEADKVGLQRYLRHNGQVGIMPDWYPLIRAARYLGVAPWELAQQWTGWMNRALVAESAEVDAENWRIKHNKA